MAETTERPRLDQNLLKPVHVPQSEAPPGFYQLIVLDVLSVGLALALSYLYRLYLGGAGHPITLFVTLALFLVLSVLGLFLRKEAGRRAIVLVLEVIALTLPFYDRPLKLVSLTAFVFLVFLSWGETLSRAEIGNSLEIRFIRSAKPFLEKATTAIVLGALLIYIPQWDAKNIFVSERVFSSVFDWAAGVANNFYPEFKFTSSIGQFSESIARNQIESSPGLKLLSAEDKQKAVASAADQIIQSFGRSLGMTIRAEQSLSKTVYDFLVSAIAKWREKFGNLFLTLWILAVFGIVRSFGVIFYLIAAFLAFAAYQLFLAFNVIRVAGETRTHEVIEFS